MFSRATGRLRLRPSKQQLSAAGLDVRLITEAAAVSPPLKRAKQDKEDGQPGPSSSAIDADTVDSASSTTEHSTSQLTGRLTRHVSEMKSDFSKLKRHVPAGYRPVVIVACGSFSPPTMLHLRIFEEARDALLQHKMYAVGGFMSPTHQKYGKKTLADMHHRLNMATLATIDSDWVAVDPWECQQEGWTRTAVVLDRFAKEMAQQKIAIGDGTPQSGVAKVVLVCGSDLVETFPTIKEDGEPLWQPEDVKTILQRNGVVCLERAGSDIERIISEQEVLRRNRDNITIARPLTSNTISSTAVRQLLTAGRSIRYLVPPLVEEYIFDNDLHKLPNWQQR